eukprot:gene2505-1817_t
MVPGAVAEQRDRLYCAIVFVAVAQHSHEFSPLQIVGDLDAFQKKMISIQPLLAQTLIL